MKGFIDSIEKLTEENANFRNVIYTGKNLQLVLMTLLPGEEIGEETHEEHDQFFRIEAQAKAGFDRRKIAGQPTIAIIALLEPGFAMWRIPAGVRSILHYLRPA